MTRITQKIVVWLSHINVLQGVNLTWWLKDDNQAFCYRFFLYHKLHFRVNWTFPIIISDIKITIVFIASTFLSLNTLVYIWQCYLWPSVRWALSIVPRRLSFTIRKRVWPRHVKSVIHVNTTISKIVINCWCVSRSCQTTNIWIWIITVISTRRRDSIWIDNLILT